MLADPHPLVGRKFVSKSDNICTFSYLGEGGLVGFWQNRPTETDISECEKFMKSVLDSDIHSYDAGRKSDPTMKTRTQEKYKEFLRRFKA